MSAKMDDGFGSWWDGVTTFGNLPARAAAQFGEAQALVFEDQRFTFTDLSTRVDEAARGLMAMGIGSGEHVCIWLNNRPEWIDMMFALAKIGAVHIPINTRFRTADLDYVLGQSDATTLITHDRSGPIDYLAMCRELVAEVECSDDGTVRSKRFPRLKRIIIVGESRPIGVLHWNDIVAAAPRTSTSALKRATSAVKLTDPLFIMYTSGTTGFPKGAMRDHSLLRNHCDRIRAFGTTKQDVMLNYLPLFHIFGYADGPLLSAMAGNKQVLTTTFDPDECLDLIEAEGVTQICGFETHLKDLLEAQERRPRDVSTLRAGVFAGGMQSAVEIKTKAAKVLAPIQTLTAYGMTEIGANATISFLDSDEEQRCETSGHPCDGFTFRVIDPATGADQPVGTPGELIVKTYNMMIGYYNKPQETADAYDDAGWFHTGDMGYLRHDGYIRFMGRYKDMLKIGGENVDPMEVERHLLAHSLVHQVAVVGLPDPRMSEVAVAFIESASDAADEQAILDHCRGQIASFKIPRHVWFVDALPMTSTGKIQKAKLRTEALRRVQAG